MVLMKKLMDGQALYIVSSRVLGMAGPGMAGRGLDLAGMAGTGNYDKERIRDDCVHSIGSETSALGRFPCTDVFGIRIVSGCIRMYPDESGYMYPDVSG